jgi:type IV secretory pathway VirB10-like protein
MSRRIALALSFSMTVVVAFAIASFASQAGWLQARPDEPEAAAVEAAPAPPDSETLEPLVITDYVYQDVPVVVPSSQQASTPPPAATAPPQPTQPPAQTVAPASAAAQPTSEPPSQSFEQQVRQILSSDDGDEDEWEDDEYGEDEHEDHEHEGYEHEHEDDD